MSNFHGRRAQNVSQYLKELNAVQDATATADGAFDLDEDLTMFTNTSFYDIETGMNTDFQSQPGKPDSETPRSDDPTSAASTTMDEFSNLDFMSGDFNFPDFGAAYTSPTLGNFSESLGSHLQPIQPTPQSIYPAPPQHPHQPNGFRHQPPRLESHPGKADGSSSSSTASPVIGQGPPQPANGTNGSGGSARQLSMEEASRLAAEEDKRRRNTAASARFRIKKKQREQALEKSAKEMNEKVSTLENRIAQLETENKWLKNLIMEKNDGNEDMVKLFKDYSSKGGAAAAAAEAAAREAAKKKPAPASPEEHEGGEMTG